MGRVHTITERPRCRIREADTRLCRENRHMKKISLTSTKGKQVVEMGSVKEDSTTEAGWRGHFWEDDP